MAPAHDNKPNGVVNARGSEDDGRQGGRASGVVLLLILVVAVAFRLMFCLRYLHVDERFILENVLTFVKDHTLIPAHFQYPTFYSYLATGPTILWCAALWALGMYPSPMDVMAMRFLDALVAFMPLRLTSMVVGMATLVLIYRTGRRHYDSSTGLLAAALLAISLVHTERSALGLPDATMGFFSACSLHYALCALGGNRLRDWVLCGLFVGLGVSTKYNAACLICMPLLAHVYHLYDAGCLRHPSRWVRREVILCGLAAVCAFLAASPGWLLRPDLYWSGIQAQSGFSHTGVLGVYKTPYLGWFERLWERETFLGIAFLVSLIAGLIRRDRRDCVLIAAVLPAVVLMGGWRYGGLHYFMFAYPSLVLLTARMLMRMAAQRKRHPVGVTCTLAPVVACLLGSAWNVIRPAWTGAWIIDSRWVAQKWMYQNVPEGSRVACDPFGVPRLQAEGDSGLIQGDRAAFFRDLLKDSRRYKLTRTPYESGDPGRVEADYLLVSSPWYERFGRPSPGLDSPYEKDHRAASRFYGSLLDSPGVSGWRLTTVFDTGNGPRLILYQRMETATSTSRPSSVKMDLR